MEILFKWNRNLEWKKLSTPKGHPFFFFTSENFHLNHAFDLHFNWKFWLNGKPSMVLVDS